MIAFKGAGPIAPRNGSACGFVPEYDDVSALRDPSGYSASEDLARAVNVALELTMPLLVTGETGTGKTQLAYRIAAELGLSEPLRFDTKSSSQAPDLFYTFDNLRQFAQSQLSVAQNRSPPNAVAFIRYAALGLAILQSKDLNGEDGADVRLYVGGNFQGDGPRQTVVLVDEIDKAPRDFPNDLLNQIENLEFYVPELGVPTVRANRRFPPIVVITSNSEKQLPEPFLRRCIYHNIEFPKDVADIDKILGTRLSQLKLTGEGYSGAIKFFFRLRADDARLIKKPSTSELLDWLRALQRAGFNAKEAFGAQSEIARNCLGGLVKTGDDMKVALRLLRA